MDHVNDSGVANGSNGGDPGSVLSQDRAQGSNLEAYTVVLSTAAHLLSMLFGGGSSIAVMVAITTRHNISKYSYTLVLLLFGACCCLNFIWSPMEVTDLVMYHYVSRHPCDSFVGTKTALYLYLTLVVSSVVVCLSGEALLRMTSCFKRQVRTVWLLVCCVVSLLFPCIFISIFIVKHLHSGDRASFSYLIQDRDQRTAIVSLIALAFCVTFTILIFLALCLLKDSLYWEDGRPHLKQKKLKLAIPEFLISQSNNACADNDGGFEHSPSGTPTPSTPKLLMLGDPETASIKGEDDNDVSDLPSPMSKMMGSRLGINMAQVLGRRRHTICQISDSSSGVTTPADPISKAKQYNYVRKFSVDISALQAQLQNPKVFKEAPFQSDFDLSKKMPTENGNPPTPKALLPLKPIPLNLDDEEEKSLENVKKEADPLPNGGLSPPPPPVIMVSNDDAPPSSTAGDAPPSEALDCMDSFHQQTPADANANAAAQKPTSLTFKELALEDHISAPTMDSVESEHSEDEPESQKMLRLTVLLCVTFTLNLLPVFVTELLSSTLSSHAFINISTCTLAVSTIQTIVYPHIIACSDDVVHRAVDKLKTRVKKLCFFRDHADAQNHVEDSSSTSQV